MAPMKPIVVITIKRMLSIKFTISTLRPEISVRCKYQKERIVFILQILFVWSSGHWIDQVSFLIVSARKLRIMSVTCLQEVYRFYFYAPHLFIPLFSFSSASFRLLFLLCLCLKLDEIPPDGVGQKGEKRRLYYMQNTILDEGKKNLPSVNLQSRMDRQYIETYNGETVFFS